MERERILFVCSQNQWRSLTAERLLEASPEYEVRSAGTERGARIRVTGGLLSWANRIFVMEPRHRDRLRQKFPDYLTGKEVICLRIPDRYDLMQPDLIEKLRERLAPYLRVPGPN